MSHKTNGMRDNISRRRLLWDAAGGIGGLALWDILNAQGLAAPLADSPLARI